MSVVVVTPPEPVVSLEEAKAHLRVDDTDDDTLIEAMVAAATGHLDGPDGILGRALGEQDLELRLDCFPAVGVKLPLPPFVSIDTFTYVDVDGAAQTVDADLYRLTGEGTSKTSIVLAYGQSWPALRSEEEAVRVAYRAGYAEGIPAPLKAAILLMVGDLYANRETAAAGATSEIPMSTTVRMLVAPYIVY